MWSSVRWASQMMSIKQSQGSQALSQLLVTSLDNSNFSLTQSVITKIQPIYIVFAVDSRTLKLDIHKLKSWLLTRPENVYVTILTFSRHIDDDNYLDSVNLNVMKDLLQWSRRVPRLSLVNDYTSEMNELMRLREANRSLHFTFDDYVARALLSCVDPAMNNQVEISCCNIL